ncbi:MAG TPA: hypothetical protein VF421_09775 [Niabella sp.]
MGRFIYSVILLMAIAITARSQSDSTRIQLNHTVTDNGYVELQRGPQKILLTVNHYTRRLKTLRRFSIYNISAGGAALTGGIYLLATANRSFSPEVQEWFGRLGIGAGSLAITGGIVGLIIANSKLYKLKNKVALRISEREGKIIYKF